MNTLHPKYEDRKLKVCAYARISNAKEELEGSLQTQISYYTDLILKNPDWEYAGLYADEGISGTLLSTRTQFKKMIQNAEAGLIDIILVKSISRFSRNVIDTLTILRKLKLKSVEIYFEKEQLSSLDFKCEQMITLFSKFAEEEAINVSYNVRWRVKKNMSEGSYTFPSNFMGYTKDERGKIAIDESRAKWIRLIYTMYVNGRSYDEIIAELERNSVLTPSGMNKWNRNSIHGILINEKYVGDCIMQKEYVLDPLSHKTYRNYGEKEKFLIKDGHPAIVDRELWNKAQEIRKERAILYKVQTGPIDKFAVKPDFTFSKFAYCPYCGKAYVTKVNHYNGVKTRRYLLCSSNRYSHICEGQTVFIDVLSIAIINQINELKRHEQVFKRTLIEKFIDPEEDDNQMQLKILISQLGKYQQRYGSLTDKIDDFSIKQKEELTNRINELMKEKMELENKLLTSDTPEVKAQRIISTLRDLPNSATSIDKIEFRSLFNNVVVKNQNYLIFTVGSDDITKVDITKDLLFKTEVEYRIRKTNYKCICGIQIIR